MAEASRILLDENERQLENYDYPAEAVAQSLAHLPKLGRGRGLEAGRRFR